MEVKAGKTFVHCVNVSWGDCDPAKIAYTGKLPTFALDAINAWWESVLEGDGWYQMELDRNVGTPFVRLEIDFKKPVTPRHALMCHVWPVKLGRTSIVFRVDGIQNEVLCFSTRTVSVFTVADTFEKQQIPTDLRKIVLTHISEES